MNTKSSTAIFAVTATFVLAFSCNTSETPSSLDSEKSKQEIPQTLTSEDMEIVRQAKKFFRSLPEIVKADYEITDEMVELGKSLYYDTRLSKSNTISCNSCHNIATFGVDNNPTSIGHGWATGPRNSPTVLNAALHSTQFWDGRAANVEEQAKGPVLNPIEMGSPHEEFVVDRLASIQGYQDMFSAAFPGSARSITYDNMARAIGAFERTLITPAPYDRFVSGDGSALTESQKNGLKTFIDVGCTTCHTGPSFGGEMLQKFGLIKGPYWEYTGSKTHDEGKFEVTGEEFDKYVFKVPGLRNITKTAPYFHDGSVWSLHEAIKIMGITQLGKDLSDEQIDAIADFLESLTGEIPIEARTLPVLPVSSKKTSRPDFS